MCSVEIALVQSVADFTVHLSSEIGKLILVTHVLEYGQLLGIR